MASPVSDRTPDYSLTVQPNQNHQYRQRVEPTAQEVADYAIPILANHQNCLLAHARLLEERLENGLENVSGALLHVDSHVRRLETNTETVFRIQADEIRRLRDLPCNRLQLAASAACTDLRRAANACILL